MCSEAVLLKRKRAARLVDSECGVARRTARGGRGYRRYRVSYSNSRLYGYAIARHPHPAERFSEAQLTLRQRWLSPWLSLQYPITDATRPLCVAWHSLASRTCGARSLFSSYLLMCAVCS